ncbi:phosphoethanolamine transferase [bacterium]|nr:phosphoethanolamine transferase [bacterium]
MITPFELELLWKEKGEIIESGIDTFPECLIFILCVLIPYSSLIFGYIKKHTKKGLYITSIIIICMFISLAKRAMKEKEKIGSFMPRNDIVSIYNTLNAFSGLLNRIYFSSDREINIKKYEPYTIKNINLPADEINVVIIMGESDNPYHMSLFGYERHTTPKLDKRAMKDKNFIYKQALSSGVFTSVSTTMFFNIQREPDNIIHTSTQPVHLFKLAKKNDFTTVYISSQDIGIARGIVTSDTDISQTREYAPLLQERKGDLSMIERLEDMYGKLGKRNFIVLHQRNIHSPYEKRYKNFPMFDKWQNKITDSREQKLCNTYDNAMLLNDNFIDNVISYFEKKTDKPTYIFWIPDHSELLGKNGKFGHGFLDIEVAKIPFIATIVNGKDESLTQKLNSMFMPTHYEIGKTIANILGFEIINPNEKDGIFFINGTVINGEAGWIEIDKSDKKILKTKNIHPL